MKSIAVLITTLLSSPAFTQAPSGTSTRELSFVATSNFGNIHVLGSSSIGFVRATSSGTEPVTITADTLTGDPDFVMTVEPTLPATIQPGRFIIWNYRFFPQEPGEKTAQLTITSDASGSPHTLAIKGNAVDTPLGPWEWEFVGRPLGNRSVHAIWLDPEDDDLWYVNSQVGLFVTRDAGASWEQPLSGSFIHRDAFAIDPADPNKVYSALGSDLYFSANKGLSWNLLRSFPRSNPIYSLIVSPDDGTVYVPYAIGIDGNDLNPGIYISRDSGQTWVFHSFGFSENNIIPWDIVRDPVNGNLYVGTEIGDHPQPYEPPFFRSLDDGETWEEVSGILPWHGTKLQIDPASQDVYYLTEGTGLYRSPDAGVSWELLSNYFWLELFLDETRPSRLYGGAHTFAGGSGGALMSDDGGISFDRIGLSALIVGSLASSADGQTLFAACFGAGIFKTPVPAISTPVEPSIAGIPKQFVLGQNYPNPFNPQTTIFFDLPRSSHVKLSIFDMLGQEIAVLASGEFPAGRFTAVWEVTGHPSGVYLYRLQAGDHSETRRLVLLK